MFFIIAGVVLVTQGTRRIPVQYAKELLEEKFMAELLSIFR
jgi:preprotein translocase subunit SecY